MRSRTHSRRTTIERNASGRLRYPVSPDAQYKAWLNSRTPDVPHEYVKPWLEMLYEEHGTQEAVENLLGLSARAQYRIMQGGACCSHETAERLAFACNKLSELAAITPLAGEEGWGPCGETSCDGCGTWFHEHHADGMCEECFNREVLGRGPRIPRDVRMTRGRS